MQPEIHFFRLTESYAILQCKARPSKALLKFIVQLKKELQEVCERPLQHTYTEIGIDQCSAAIEIKIRNISNQFRYTQDDHIAQMIEIPVCYDPTLALDIEDFAQEKKQSVSQIVALHTKPNYLVYFNGFLPGFPYLLGLDEQLHCPRKSTPVLKIPKGTVAIGGDQTGIYPQESPAGWWNIGHCPLPLFSVSKPDNLLLNAGDHIRFYAVSLEEHAQISDEIKNDKFSPKRTSYAW